MRSLRLLAPWLLTGAAIASCTASGTSATGAGTGASSSQAASGVGGSRATSSTTGPLPSSASSSGSGGAGGSSAISTSSASSTGSAGSASSATSATSATSSSGGACTTRITYGDAWIAPGNHPNDYDDASGLVTWDGTCTTSGSNSYAVLSNGWKPYFTGVSGCVMALDTTCPGAPACTTRVSYGSTWIAASNHPNSYDDVAGRVSWDRSCTASGPDSIATLSNGWAPHFTGSKACELSLAYTGCGGLYKNSVLPSGCADPGVLWDGTEYVLACTSGDATNAFPIHTSPDLATWTAAGSIFPSANKPTWAMSDYWAPEIHKVGSTYVAYFTARDTDGMLSIGAATSPTSKGPFTDIGHPLVHDSSTGLIDPTEFVDDNGAPYVVWKVDGNATGKPTPIYAQPLTADGTALLGSSTLLITNDQAWEGAVTEGPWVVRRSGYYYLFYSGNSYASSTYAVGVARASSPLGPYTKLGPPILTTNASWVGPGHCSVLDTPSGDTAMIYHAWIPGMVNGTGDTRVLLVDQVVWSGSPAWPSVPESPSASSRPLL